MMGDRCLPQPAEVRPRGRCCSRTSTCHLGPGSPFGPANGFPLLLCPRTLGFHALSYLFKAAIEAHTLDRSGPAESCSPTLGDHWPCWLLPSLGRGDHSPDDGTLALWE